MLELIRWIINFKNVNTRATKTDIQNAILQNFEIVRQGSVLVHHEFAIRFSEVNGKSFSNVVLSLSRLLKHDHSPFVVCVVTPSNVYFRLANTTFLKKISHSSMNLDLENIVGSFLGTDILSEYDEIQNTHENFLKLYSIHKKFDIKDNIKRLVSNSKKINSKIIKFQPNKLEHKVILDVPKRFESLIKTSDWIETENSFKNHAQKYKIEILEAAKIENNKIRGREIEKIFTGNTIHHSIGDIEILLPDETVIFVDIKSKLQHLSSAPKGYNIDKFLKLLSDQKKMFAFLFVVVDMIEQDVRIKLIQPFDPTLMKFTIVQPHWAGRGTRGATQLTVKIREIFDNDYKQSVDYEVAVQLLEKFLRL